MANSERDQLLSGFEDRKGSKGLAWPAVACALASAVAAVLFGYTLGFTSPAQAAMVGDVFDIDECQGSKTVSSQAALFGALANIGAMLGALLAAWLTERFGRKKAVMFAALPHIAGWVWIANGEGLAYWHFVVARLLTGLGVGVGSVAVPTYITETTPDRLRGALGTMNQFGIVWGIFAVYVVGVLLPSETNKEFNPHGDFNHHNGTSGKLWCDPNQKCIQDHWPILGWIGAALSLFLLLVMLPMPESPKWLVQHGRQGDARAAITWLRGRMYDPDPDLEELQTEEQGEEPGTFSDLCVPALRMPVVICFTMMVVQQLSGINAVVFYVSDIFHDAGSNNDDLSSLLVSVVQIVFTGVAALLIDRAGRKLLLLLSSAGMSLFCALLGLFFFINKGVSVDNIKLGPMALLSVMGYIMFFSLGVGAIPWVLMGELFPGKVRGVASSLATVLNWTLSFIVTEVFHSLQLALHEYGTFWLFAAICFFGFLFVLLFVVETKGKTFQEIQAHFSRDRSDSVN